MGGNSPEGELIARTPAPRTRDGLARDLRALGVEPGMALLVHASLSRVGWVVGGARSVIEALMNVLTLTFRNDHWFRTPCRAKIVHYLLRLQMT